MANTDKNENRQKESLRTWLRLLSCESMIEQRLRSVFRQQFDVTLPQFDVLSELEHASAPLTMSELSHELMVSNGNITGVIDRLVTMELVQRERPEHDRRIQFIQLTEKGSKEFRRMAEVHEAWVDHLFTDLNLKDMQQLQTLLLKARNSAVSNEDQLNSSDESEIP
ncbi:MAG: MarR family transcriptional regulator [Xanthomonadales bacterium]|nr:MarR family transcriptional regulator [Xanthomonadales bacterium]